MKEVPVPPYLRGYRPCMLKTMDSSPIRSFEVEDSNALRRNLAAEKRLSIAFDLACIVGTTPSSLCCRRRGNGVAIDSILDMEVLFDGIPPTR